MKLNNIDEILTEAMPTLQCILAPGCREPMAQQILLGASMQTVNTIQLLMYIGRDELYKQHKKPYKNPTVRFRNWAIYMNAYDNHDKPLEVDCILGKLDYKRYIRKGCAMMSLPV